jgi:hypothetical protein
LDELFTQVLAALVEKKLVRVDRISQDGVRVRACAGNKSFGRKKRLDELLLKAKAHVEQLRSLLEDPEKSAGLSAKKKAAQVRAARERQERVEAALALIPQLESRQEATASKAGSAQRKPPRASITDPESRVMKMPDNGWRPAVNVQLATDTQSRAVVGVDVSGAGSDKGQAPAMRQQVEQRTGLKVGEHLVDGGYLVLDEIEQAETMGVRLYIPPMVPRDASKAGTQYDPKPADSEALKQWRARMGSESGKEIYKERAATSETVNADLKTHRGLTQLAVCGLVKAKCVVLWCALAYNLMHFGGALLQ